MPCLNEEEGLKAIKSVLPPYIDEVLVVDNGSTDLSASVAKRLGFRVIPEPLRGYGSAYRKGFKNISPETDIVVTCDADGTYPLEELPPILDKICDGTYDFISCSRFPLKTPKSMSKLNRWGNRLLTIIFNMISGYKLRDLESGMWILRRTALSQLELHTTGMEFSQEIKLVALSTPGIRFSEYPISYHTRHGRTKLNILIDGCRDLWHLFHWKNLSTKSKGKND